jgi:hypothetical protein
MLDKDVAFKRLSDLPGQLSGKKESLDKHILTEFITNKRLLCYDLRGGTFFDERQDKAVIDRFFKEAKGSIIKGFKTANFLVCDV